MADYFVRPNLQLHRQVEVTVKGQKSKTTKLYQAEQKIENITDQEIKRYQHLIESEEQVKSRQSKTSKAKTGDK